MRDSTPPTVTSRVMIDSCSSFSVRSMRVMVLSIVGGGPPKGGAPENGGGPPPFLLRICLFPGRKIAGGRGRLHLKRRRDFDGDFQRALPGRESNARPRIEKHPPAPRPSNIGR